MSLSSMTSDLKAPNTVSSVIATSKSAIPRLIKKKNKKFVLCGIFDFVNVFACLRVDDHEGNGRRLSDVFPRSVTSCFAFYSEQLAHS